MATQVLVAPQPAGRPGQLLQPLLATHVELLEQKNCATLVHAHCLAVQVALLPQDAQAAPPLPQAVAAVPGIHVVPMQQPCEHEKLSQTHCPPRQRCPAPQAAFTPHMQAPLVHELATSGSHSAQAAPPTPQCTWLLVWHAPLAQHPAGQFCALHVWQAPATHDIMPTGHATHAPPLLPQAAAVAPP